jgi:hypothetical protein
MTDYNAQMNSQPLIGISEEVAKKLAPGSLVGFKAFGKEITAAYPLKVINGRRIHFYLINEPGRMVTDGTVIDGCFVNDPPIVVELHEGPDKPFGLALAEFFNGMQPPSPL